MRKFAIALLVIISAFTLSCEIGLGSAVDTEAPTLVIKTPSVDSVIRDDFAITGTYEDDGNIASIVARLERTDGGSYSTSISASLIPEKRSNCAGTYKIVVPAKSQGIPDGSYQAIVTATDETGRTTIRNTTFTIDNTPPVIVLQRPGTADGASSPDTYGRIFTLEGMGADDNYIDHIDIDVYNENDIKIHTVTLKNVPQSISLNIAEYGDDDYTAIYGNVAPENFIPKNYTCTLRSYDGAQRYPADSSAQSEDDLKGNYTDTFYIYKDISKPVLSTTKVTEIYHILNGSLTAGSGRSADDIDDILETLEAKARGIGSFILDPKNNPTFSVAGKSPLISNVDCLDDSNLITQYSITNGSDITLQVTVGLDNTPLVHNDTKKIEVYYQECEFNSATGMYEPKAGAPKIYPVIPEDNIKPIGSNYQITVDVKSTGSFKTGSGKLEVGHKYLILVDGEDENEQPILPASIGYGFVLTTNVSAPTLKDITPDKSTIYVKKDNPLIISGITKLTEGQPRVTIRWTEEPDTVWDSKDMTVSDWVTDPTTGNKIEDEYGFTFTIPASKFNEKSSSASKEFSLEIRTENSGKTSSAYKTVMYDCDLPEIKELTITPEIDVSAKPSTYAGKDKTVLNGNITVKAILEDTFTSPTGWKYEIWQKNNQESDTRIYQSELQSGSKVDFSYNTNNLIDNKDAVIKLFAYDKANNDQKQEIECYIDQSTDKPSFEAQDGTSWKTGIRNPFYINKHHDNLFTGNLYSKLTDDDGVKYLKVEVKPVKAKELTGTATKEDDKTFVGYEIDNSRTLASEYALAKKTFENTKKEDSYTHNMPSKSGFYEITQTVYDKNFAATGDDGNGNLFPSDADEANTDNANYFTKETYLIKIKGTGAQFSLKADTSYVSQNNKTKDVTVTITLDDGEAPYQFYLNNKLLDGTNGTNAPVLTSEEEPVTYTHTFKVNDIYKDTGDIIAEYKITDANDSTGTNKSIKFQRDDNYPTYKNVKIEANTENYAVYKPRNEDVYYVNNKEQTFTISGLATDETSAVDRIYLEAVNVDSNGDAIAATPKINMDNTTGFFDNISFKNDETPWTGGAKVTIWVVDIAGNSSKGRTGNTSGNQVVLDIKFDSTAPVVEHDIDKNSKDLVFRIGDYSNDAGTITDVGGKYYKDTYGNATSIMIRGNFHDETNGSGIDKYYYLVSKKEIKIGTGTTDANTMYFADTDSLINYVIENKTDTFAPLASTESRVVEYTKSDDSISTKTITSNFKTTIKGFEEGSNFLVLVAEDNVGNKTLDSATISGVIYPCYQLNVDLVTPSITPDQTGLVYTNVDSTSADASVKFEVSGKVSDKPNKANGSSKIKKIVLKSDKSEDTITIAASELTEEGLTDEQKAADPTLKIWKKDIKSILPSNGQAVISITVTDNVGFDKTETVTVFVDRIDPTVIINSHQANDKSKKTLTLKGTVADVNGSGIDTAKPISVYFTTKASTTTAPETEPAANADASAGWKKYGTATLDDNGTSWSCDIDFSGETYENLIKEGENTTVYFTVSAIDKADTVNNSGNTGYSEVLPLVIDRKGPVHNKAASGVGDYLGDAVSSDGTWFTGSSLVISGSFTDEGGTGVKQIKYQVGTGEVKTVVPDNGAYNTNASGFTSGTNTLQVWAIDAADNESEKTEYTVRVDNSAPRINPINITDVKLTNGNTPITKTFYVTEPLTESGIAGAAAITIKVGDHDVTPADGDSKSQITVGNPDDTGKRLVTVRIGKDDLTEVTGYQTILATATDKAGKVSTPASVGIVNKDDEPPVASFTSPDENASVNKTITVSGKIVDTSNITKITLVANCAAAGKSKTYEYPAPAADSGKGTIAYANSIWSIVMDTTELDDTFTLAKDAEGNYLKDDDDNYVYGNAVTLSLTAEDEAGNPTASATNLSLKIDQHGDRPVITIGSNVDITSFNNKDGIDEIWVKGSSTIYGSVQDDDGIASDGFKVLVKGEEDDDFDYSQNVSYKGGSWNVKLPNDGSYILKFEVKDKGQFVDTADNTLKATGTTFTSNDLDGTCTDAAILATPVIQDATTDTGAHRLGSAKHDYPSTIVPICLDTQSPTLIIEAISHDGTTWEEDINKSDFYLGGKNDIFYVKVRASDTSGLAETDTIKASFTGSMEITENSQQKTYKVDCPANACTVANILDGENKPTNEFIITVTNFKTAKNIEDATDIRNDFSGTLLLTITAKDKAALTTDKQLSKTVDNNPPTIKISAPTAVANTATVSGSIEGEIVNPSIYYMLTKASGYDTEGSHPAENSDDWKQDKFASLSYNIYFDGITSTTATHTDLFRDWLPKVDSTITVTAIANGTYKTLTPVYVWIKAVDVCGNTNYEKAEVVVDPQGNRPTVTVSYPESNGEKLGGTIRLMGTANDDKEAKYVWVKIDTDNDGEWKLADYTKLASATNSAYKFGQISKNKKIGTGQGEVNITPSASNISDIAIMVKVSGGSWNQTINADGELIPDGLTSNNVTMWVSATDDDTGTGDPILESVAVIRNFTVDKDNPYFVQDSLKLTTDSGSKQSYKEGMSVKGEWWLEGTIIDDGSGIRRIAIKEEGSDHDENKITSSGQEITTGDYQFRKNVIDGNINYNFRIKVGATEGVGQKSFRVTAYENNDHELSTYKDFLVRYDNQPPSFEEHTSESFQIEKTVKNSQGYYHLSSIAYEKFDGDTGVERIAVYFTRTIGTTTYIFDPMYKRTVTDKAKLTTVTTGTGIKKDTSDNLYWGSATASKIVADKLTLSAAPESYVHVGGLAKVNGVVYRINSVEGNEIGLSGEPGNTTTATTVNFAVANVVDNTSPESKKENASANTAYDDTTGYGYGYCNDYIYEDGDCIMENLHKDDSKSWTWELYVNSKNILDGDVDIHYVVFDKAGNCTHDEVTGASVENNKPRLVSVLLGVDINQDGNITASDNEITNYYPDGLADKPVRYANAATKIDIDGITVKGKMTVTPEIVGGNGDLFYQYKTKKSGDAFTKVNTKLMDGNDDYDDANFSDTDDYVSENVLTIQSKAIEHDTSWLINNSTDNASDYYISYEIYDSTEGKTLFESSNKVSINITNINLLVRDKTDPVVSITPFYWEGLTKNSVYTSKTSVSSVADLEGHIELNGDLPETIFKTTNTGVYDKDDKVSGKIKIEGTASDNKVLKSLYISIPGMTGTTTTSPTKFAGVELPKETIGGVDYYKVATYDKASKSWKNAAGSAVFSTVGSLSTNGFEFTVKTDTNTFDIDEGHSVDWQLLWDSAKLTDVAKTDVSIKVIAFDDAKNAGQNADRSGLDTRKVDVVPYITKISTGIRTASGLKDNNIRSASGKYSILANNASNTITVSGFNFAAGNNLKAKIAQSKPENKPTEPYGTGLTAATADTAENVTTSTVRALTITQTNTTTATITNSDITKSGYLELFSNNVRALNNINENNSYGKAKNSSGEPLNATNATISDYTNAYNREPDYYTTKNVQLTDDRYFRFFDMKDTGKTVDLEKRTKNGQYPTMFMEGDSPVFGYFNPSGGIAAEKGDEAGTGAGTAGNPYFPEYAMPQRIKFNPDGSEVYTEYLAMNSAGDQMGTGRDDSGRYYHISVFNRGACAMYMIYDRYEEFYTTSKGWAPGVGYGTTENYVSGGSNNGIALESIDLGDIMAGRYQYPKIIAKGDSKDASAYVYCAYYDDYYGQIIMRVFRCGKTVTGNGTYQLDSTHKDLNGTTYAQRINFQENGGYTGDWAYYYTTDYSTGRLKGTEQKKGSKYFDMKVTSDYHIILIWYSEEDSCLKLRYSTNPVTGNRPTTEIDWSESTVKFPNYVGNYVSLDLDSQDRLHISAFDAGDSNLVYMYLPSYSSTALTAVTVDQASSVGNWTQIKVNSSDVPYIAYYNSTETGGRDSIKLAYANASAGSIGEGVEWTPGESSGNGYTTGNWEYMTVPAVNPPQGGSPTFQNVCLGFDSHGTPVVGYAAKNLEFGKWMDE